jgi:2-C-methyl-D-erythritol 4-phosphate cytidylyltransferase
MLMRVFVILPAAGMGTRMAPGHATPNAPKQFLALHGIPILVHSLRAFAAVPRVSSIFVAVRKPEISRMEAMISEHALATRVQVVEGGDTRQESVSQALKALSAADPATIERTIEAVEIYGAAIVGLPAVDTIKQVERTARGAIVTATIPREHIVQAQTPQGFRWSILRRAFADAEEDGFVGTDEASLVERSGAQVAVVMGSPANLKITHPGDLKLAEFYLQDRS